MKRGNMPFGGAVVLAGLAGGLAEVIWIASYSLAVGAEGWQVARAVAEVVVPGGALSPSAPAIGIVIHFLLSIALAGMFAVCLSIPVLRHRSIAVTVTLGTVALAAVWAVNFLVILPVVHPAFVHLLPYPVTLLSKLFFGLVMGWSLAAARGTATVADTTMAVPTARV
ncbi:MAG: hypothetical protein HY082_01870 [Gammaproteobacteria bacterium]|nr:hypothetical protein [Gammaproteobacteria bacterium]